VHPSQLPGLPPNHYPQLFLQCTHVPLPVDVNIPSAHYIIILSITGQPVQPVFLVNSVPRWCQAWSCCPWPATVVFVLLPKPFSIHHGSSDTLFSGAHEPINLDGFVSPHHPHPVMQMPLSMSFLPLHITFEESWDWHLLGMH